MADTRRARRTRWTGVLITALLLGGLVGRAAPGVAADAPPETGVTTIVGTVDVPVAQDSYGNITLFDLTGFVRRDFNYVQGSQPIVGWVDHATGNYQVDLPIAPAGPFNNVGHHAGDRGVQSYAIDAWSDSVGDGRPGPWDARGWNWTNTSLLTAHGTHEVTGGQIAVWAPDALQRFPTGMGADGKLFTADDPVGPLASGWSVIDLNEKPFARIRTARASVPITADELAPVDLSQLPPTQAFDKLVAYMQARYPIADAQPVDWAGLKAKYRPAFAAAERSGEAVDFQIAMNRFTIDVNHWGYGTIAPWTDHFLPMYVGATGLNVDATDDGKVIVVKVVPGQAADRAGIKVGAELVTWDGKPTMQAVREREQVFAESSPQTALRQKLDQFGRLPAGTKVAVTYRNPGQSGTSSVTLTAVAIPSEQVGLSAQCVRHTISCSYQTPVTVEWLPSRIAVLWVPYFASPVPDQRLIAQAWERAIEMLSGSDAKGLIVDVRSAGPELSGLVPLYAAGSFFKQPFPVAQLTSVDDEGRITDEGTLTVTPSPAQWDKPVAVLVDEWCKGDCELFVQAMTHKPGAIIAGMTPTCGAVVMGGQPVLLPADDLVMIADQALRDPQTHKVIIEGIGIAPTLRVPKTAASVVAAVTGDPVQDAAEHALLAQVGTGH